MRRRCCLIITAVLATIVASHAAASTVSLVDTLDEPAPLSGNLFLKSNQWVAAQFITDNRHYRLDSFLFNTAGRPEVTDIVGGVSAADGPSGTPGTLLSPLVVPATPFSGPAAISPPYLPETEILLEPNTPYWVFLGRLGAGGTNPIWLRSEEALFDQTLGFPGTPGFPADGVRDVAGVGRLGPRPAVSFNQGATWGILSTAFPQQLRVVATIIPEPTTALLTVMMVFACGYRRDR